MMDIYSGSLVFEYSNETNGYGVIKVQPDGTILELQGFQLLATALSQTQNSEGDGRYKEQGTFSQCPKPSQLWLPQNNSLPSTPGVAEFYYKNGAGAGKGADGAPKCSQWCGDPSIRPH